MVALRGDEDRGEDHPRANIHGTMLLKDIGCAKCCHYQRVGNHKLRTSTGFSMVKCRNALCGEFQCSSLWQCRCNVGWIKCPRHVLCNVGDCTHLAAVRRGNFGDQHSRTSPTGERARDAASSCSWTTAQTDLMSRPSEAASENREVGRSMSDWECRKRAKIKKAALVKETSNASWLTTNVPAVLRARFSHLFKDAPAGSSAPSLPVPNLDTG